ncbi:DICT sensory domain-containing protein [Haloparvum sedimenti]|uniref:DICT sensory domain-containing protein n=1 Tax=Haloparvum sedimenti TaxID=1678448 RepID=UPI00071E7036|nr:DICT sensory domain-containing protein [Haloparvum sedimenti]
MVDSLREFIDRANAPDRSLLLINRSSPDAVRNLLGDLLDTQPVAVEDVEMAGEGEDLVALVEDGDIVARSPLSALMDSILLINSDLFKTGARKLTEIDLPDVFEGLDDFAFTVRGYPASNKEKLLLIVMSRVIERTAYEAGAGTLRSSFQRLSRLQDERGTNEVYRSLGETTVDVHVYGRDDWADVHELPVTVHAGDSYEYRRSWFVVFTPDDPDDRDDHVGLVAIERERNVWDGYWTFDAGTVREIEAYLASEL